MKRALAAAVIAAVLAGAIALIARHGNDKPRRAKAFKGMELYSWQDADGNWCFSLLTGTNANKAIADVKAESTIIKGFAALKAKLTELAVGESVFWIEDLSDGSAPTGLGYPPKDVIDDLMLSAQGSQVGLVLVRVNGVPPFSDAAAPDQKPTREGNKIPSLDDTADDPVPNDWSRTIVSHFRKASEQWSKVQSAAGVREVIGEPKYKKTDGVRYKVRGAEVVELWIYEKYKNRVDYQKGETYRVIVGFDDKGRTLYCATIDENIICGGLPVPPKSAPGGEPQGIRDEKRE
jgi:hypothetical protein